MISLHAAHSGGPKNIVVFEVAVAAVLTTLAIGYGLALVRARGRGRWPAARTIMWYTALACAGAALVGPLAAAAHTSFTAHMVGHLLMGMLAPLLIVLAAPITLSLRALPVTAARRLSRVLRSPLVRFVSHPAIAALLNAGGLWLLYTTDLFHLMHASAAVHALVHLHIFLAGCVFTASIVGVDPDPHRATMLTRSAVLVVFIAAHQILAKRLYANPPAGVDALDARIGAQVMYYGGDAVDVALIILLFAGYAKRRNRVKAPGLDADSQPLPRQTGALSAGALSGGGGEQAADARGDS